MYDATDDPYTYENSTVLVNKLDLRDQSELDDFEAEILPNEVVVAHIREGHVYHFSILTNDTVSLHGLRIEPNPSSKREARQFLQEAHNAARAAFGNMQRLRRQALTRPLRRHLAPENFFE